MKDDTFIKEVKDLLVGWTIADVVPSQASEGPVFRLKLYKQGGTGVLHREADIAASLGPWIDQVIDLPDSADEHPTYPDFEAMMRQMEHHMFYAELPSDKVWTESDSDPEAPPGSTVTFDKVADAVKDDDLSNLFVAVEDVFKRQIGFRCTVTGKEWWCSLNAVKQSRHKDRLTTAEGRAHFARFPPFWPDRSNKGEG